MQHRRAGSAVRNLQRLGRVSVLAGLVLPLSLSAQTPAQESTSEPQAVPAAGASAAGAPERSRADSLALVHARGDSARAALVQPPGEYGGVRGADLIRLPFQLFGTGLLLGAAGVGAVYDVVDDVVIEPALHARDALSRVGVESRVTGFSNRGWPGLILRWEGASPFFVEAGYSLRQYEHYAAGVELGSAALGLEAAALYRRMRQPHFWGVGPGSRDEDRSDYAADVAEAGAHGWWNVDGGPVTLSAGGAWESTRLLGRGWDGSRPDTREVFGDGLYGLDGRTEYVRVESAARFSATRVRGIQTRGAWMEGRWQHYAGLGGAAGFDRLSGDARFLVPANERQLLALRVLVEDRPGADVQRMPFTHLAELGGDHGLRGYSGRRFRDRALLAGQLEWRYMVYWHPGFPEMALEGFAFVDAGTVAPSLASIDWSAVVGTPGLGLRFVQRGRAVGEAYLSRGGEGWRVGVGTGRTF